MRGGARRGGAAGRRVAGCAPVEAAAAAAPRPRLLLRRRLRDRLQDEALAADGAGRRCAQGGGVGEDGEADRARVANLDGLLGQVAEGARLELALRRRPHDLPRVLVGEAGAQQVLREAGARRRVGLQVEAAGDVGRRLQQRRVRRREHDGVDDDAELLGGEGAIHRGQVLAGHVGRRVQHEHAQLQPRRRAPRGRQPAQRERERAADERAARRLRRDHLQSAADQLAPHQLRLHRSHGLAAVCLATGIAPSSGARPPAAAGCPRSAAGPRSQIIVRRRSRRRA